MPRYEVFELTFRNEGTYENPFFGVSIDVTLTSPSSKQVQLGGFYYRQDLWKARFAPSKLGRWTYRFVFRNAGGRTASGEGDFMCIKGRVPNPGFVRRNPENPYRIVFDDGTPYFPIGVQDCWGDGNHNGSVLDEFSMEGPFRTDLKDPPARCSYAAPHRTRRTPTSSSGISAGAGSTCTASRRRTAHTSSIATWTAISSRKGS